MQYGKIVSTGFSQAWKYKTLWIFGFFISGGGAGYLGDIGDKIKVDAPINLNLPWLQRALVDNIGLVLLAAVLILLAIVIWIILSTISSGGLIHAAGQIKRGEPYSFVAAFKTGAACFWPLLGILVLTIIVSAAFVIMLILSGVIAFTIHMALGVLSLLVLVPALIVGMFVIVITMAMAQRYIVLHRRPVFDGIVEGFALWRSTLAPSIVYTVIYIAISIAVFLGTLLVTLYVVIPFAAVAFLNLLAALVVGIPVVLLVLLVVDGFTGSAMHLMTTEFFFQLLDERASTATSAPAVDGDAIPPLSPPPVSDQP